MCPSTFESYERNMRNQVIAQIGAVQLTKVDAGVLNGLYAHSQVSVGGMTHQETADYLRIEFAEAENITKDTLYPHDSAPRLHGRRRLGTPRPKPGRGRPEARLVYCPIRASPTTDCSACGCCLATTGMRRGEALGLRWRDLNLDKAKLRVVQTVIQTRRHVSLSEPKRLKARRPISLDQATVAALREHRKRMVEEPCSSAPTSPTASSSINPMAVGSAPTQ